MTHITLSDGEWKLMKALWANCPCSLGTLVTALYDETKWSKSTIFVMLKRLIAKNAVSLDCSGKIQLYSPLVSREDCAVRATENLITRVYNGSVGLMLSAITESKSLTAEEIADLRSILDKAEADIENGEGK